MGSAQKGNQPDGGQRSLFEREEESPRGSENTERGLSADPNIPLQAQPGQALISGNGARLQAVQAIETPAEPIWFRRIKLVIFVMFCIELGMLLVVLPWRSVWIHNSLLVGHPELRSIMQHYFTRGAISGLGLVDVWIGIWAAVTYREKK